MYVLCIYILLLTSPSAFGEMYCCEKIFEARMECELSCGAGAGASGTAAAAGTEQHIFSYFYTFSFHSHQIQSDPISQPIHTISTMQCNGE